MKIMCSRKGFYITAIVMSFVVLFCSASGFAQDKYPDRPITIILGWAAGGQADVFTRLLAAAASKELGQPIVIENKPGAHGIVAAHSIVKAKPDGYTLGGGVSSQFLIVPNMQKINFDPLQDPTQIMVFMHYDLGLVVQADSPWKTWEDFKAYAKANPGKIRYGTAGVGTMQHLTFEMVGQKEGIKWTHIPFPSGNGPVIALLGGHVEAAIQAPADITPHIKAGKLRLLLALNDSRWPIDPNVPTIKEKGYYSTFSCFSIWGPKGLPEPIRAKLENAFHKAMKDPAFVSAAEKLQATILYIPGKEYTIMLKERFDMYKKIINDLGLAKQ
jgi:tripartite-type tricarboxylate transporter receptor subunit TctC